MAKVWIGNYVAFDAKVQDAELVPLLFCLRFALDRGRDLDFFLKGILGERGPAGGDPGWSIHWISKEDDALFPEDWKHCMARLSATETGCYEAWTHQQFSDLDPPFAYYAKEIVRHHVREVLNNFRTLHPERAAEVDAAIKRFDLQDA